MVACAPDEPLMKVDVRLRLRVVLHRDALGAGEGADHDVDLVLLHELPGRVDGHVGLRVRRGLDDLDLPARDHAVALLHGELGAPHAVLAARREGAFQGGEQADLDHLLRVGDSRDGDDHRRDREPPHALPQK